MNCSTRIPQLQYRTISSPEVLPFPQVSYSQQAEQPSYLPHTTTSTSIPGNPHSSKLEYLDTFSTSNQSSAVCCFLTTFCNPKLCSKSCFKQLNQHITFALVSDNKLRCRSLLSTSNYSSSLHEFFAGSRSISFLELPEYFPLADCEHRTFSANSSCSVLQ